MTAEATIDRRVLLGLLGAASGSLLGLPLPARADTATLRVGKAVPNAFSFVPLDIGMKAGIFARRGLTIESLAFAGSARLQQALAADSIDIGLGSGPELAFVEKGAPIIGIGAIVNAPRLTITVKSSGPIKDVKDLKGKRIAVSTVGSLTEWFCRELSRQQGWGSDGILTTPVGANTAQVAAMRSGSVDGITTDYGNGLQLEDQADGRIVVLFADIIPDFIQNVMYARKELVQSKPDQVHQFVAGWYETIAYMASHRDEAIRIAAEVLDLKPDIAARTFDYSLKGFSKDGHFGAPALKLLARSFVETGVLPKEPDMSKLYTTQFLPAAAK